MKLIADRDGQYILKHPDGSTMAIAKNGLSKDLHAKILMMAEGGVVPDQGFIPIPEGPSPKTVPIGTMPMTPPEEVVPIGVMPMTPPESKFTGVRRATTEEQMQPATFAPGTADVYKTAVDQPRPVRQAPVQPYVPEQAPGGAEEALISPLDFPVEAAAIAGAGAKGLVRGAMAGREALYKAVPSLASEVGAVGGQKVAPRLNPLGMYSKMEQTIAEKMGGSATPDQILGMLRDVKPEEIQYSGLNDFLAGKNKVSKQELLDFVKTNELPVQEKVGSTKYSQYTLPGGENYREKLYTLPEKSSVKNVKYEKNPEGEWDVLNENGRVIFTGTEEQEAKDYIKELDQVRKKDLKTFKGNYQSSHFDEPNILAHTRLNDRVDAEGRKHLFAEEIQSDWHQAGREKGYKNPKSSQEKSDIESKIHIETKKLFPNNDKLAKSFAENVISETNNGYVALTPEAPKELQELTFRLRDIGKQNVNTVPDAPMKKTWHEFVSKNLLSDAAKGGYDNVSWTTGAQQADRYDLSKQVDKVLVKKNGDGTFGIKAMKDGDILSKNDAVNDHELDALLGKDLAEKTRNIKGASDTFSGGDLKVGGEGMKGFYDKIIPDYMGKLGKKYGVKPEKTKLPKAGEIWTMKITPDMRKDIIENGLPLYSMGGVVAGGMLNGKEAEAKDMNYKLLENNKDHYVMKHPDGSSFKVAKKGLKPEVMKKIESYSDFVQRAEGQIPGVDTPEQVSSYMPDQKQQPDFMSLAQPAPSSQQDQTRQEIEQAKQDISDRLLRTYAKAGVPEDYTPERIQSMAEEQVLGGKEREALKLKNEQFLKDQEAQRQLQENQIYNERAAKVGMPLRQIPGQQQELPIGTQQIQPQEPVQPQPQAQLKQAAPVDPFALYEKGIRGEAAAKAEAAKQQAETYAQLQQDINAGNKAYNEKLATTYQDIDKFKKIAESKEVDPRRYWSNLGTANKIGASIGLILGGIGAGLAGGENAALKIIDKTIDNDIEAQKKNIDQANNLYKANLDKLKDEREAYNVTKAQLISLAELKLKEQMSQSSSKEAIAQGQIALGKLGLAKQELAQKTSIDAIMQLAQSNPKLLTPEIIQKLPVEERERVVPGYGFALSKTGAEKIRTELLPQKDTSVQMINDLMNLRQKYGREIIARDVVNEANTLRAFLRGQMRTFLVGPGAVTENEQKILDSVIADPSKILSTDTGTMAALSSLRNSIEKSFNNQARANGLIVPQAQAQGQQPVRGADGRMYIKQGDYMIPVKK